MVRRISSFRASLLLSAASFLLACFSIMLGHRVDYLDYLPLFNAMAAVCMGLSAVALTAGVVGTWRSRGRSAKLWLADAVAALILAFYVFNP